MLTGCNLARAFSCRAPQLAHPAVETFSGGVGDIDDLQVRMEAPGIFANDLQNRTLRGVYKFSTMHARFIFLGTFAAELRLSLRRCSSSFVFGV